MGLSMADGCGLQSRAFHPHAIAFSTSRSYRPMSNLCQSRAKRVRHHNIISRTKNRPSSIRHERYPLDPAKLDVAGRDDSTRRLHYVQSGGRKASLGLGFALWATRLDTNLVSCYYSQLTYLARKTIFGEASPAQSYFHSMRFLFFRATQPVVTWTLRKWMGHGVGSL